VGVGCVDVLTFFNYLLGVIPTLLPDLVSMGFLTLSLDFEVAVRLADEGVPLRVISRATRMPAGEVRAALEAARGEGRLLSLPGDDWPSGYPREARALQLSRLQTVEKATLLAVVQRAYGVTSTQAMVLLLLVQHMVVHKGGHADLNADSFDVHVCKLRRRLAPFGLKILTVWGRGYQLSVEDRHRAMDLILRGYRLGL
jgi:hypothetical protein